MSDPMATSDTTATSDPMTNNPAIGDLATGDPGAARDPMAERREQKDRILEAAFMHAAFDGWNRKTLSNAAETAGVPASTARRLFPQGGESLLAWLDDWADRRMLAAAAGADLQRLPVRRRIAWLIRTRLELLEPHREAIRRAALARLFPAQVAGTGQAVWRTAEQMWTAAGIGAAGDGASWYTRRATLAGVLTATFLYWIEDKSEDGSATWGFLDRRIEDVMRLGRATDRVRSFLGGLPGMRTT